jgi:hypothetical protein
MGGGGRCSTIVVVVFFACGAEIERDDHAASAAAFRNFPTLATFGMILTEPKRGNELHKGFRSRLTLRLF